MTPSQRARAIAPSLIRDASRYCQELGALNLAQGLPDFPAPEFLKEAARRAIADDCNQYSDPWGLLELRQALAEKLNRDNGIVADPETEITICCGATEGLNLALMTLLDPGDEVVIFTPFYENYRPNLATVGARPRFVPLQPPNWRVDAEVLARAFAPPCPKAVIVNTPANPTGKVWTRAELEMLADHCLRSGTWAVTDEIYEYIVYDEASHISLASLPGMAERTFTVNGFSKTFCVTGWRLGYVVAPPTMAGALRNLHDFLTICAPTPLQWAALAALEVGASYYDELRAFYRVRRDLLLPALAEAGLEPIRPAGAYYIWTDARSLGVGDALGAADRLAREAGIAAVPGDCFLPPETATTNLRFGYAKSEHTLRAACAGLARLRTGAHAG